MGKFKIPEIPPTINKTIRFPSDVVQAVEQAIQGKECTFSAFVIAAVRAALEDLSEYAYRLKSAAHPLASPIGEGDRVSGGGGVPPLEGHSPSHGLRRDSPL